MSAMFPPALVTAVCAARWSTPAAALGARHGLTKAQVWHIWARNHGLIPTRPAADEDDHLGLTGLSATLYRALADAGEQGLTVDELATATYVGRPPADFAMAIQKRLSSLRVHLPEGWSIVPVRDRYVLAKGEEAERAAPPPVRPTGLAGSLGVGVVERRVGDTMVSLARVRFLDGVAA